MKDYGLIYLATPYRAHPGGLNEAYFDAAGLTCGLMRQGLQVYSPIVYLHKFAEDMGLDPYSDDIWLPQMEPLMRACDTCFVGRLPGYLSSAGTQHEVNTFVGVFKPVYMLDHDTLLIHPFYLPPEKNTDGETDSQAA